MKLHDISVQLAQHTPCYPGDPQVIVESALSLENGDGAHVSRITLGSHSGTHLDAPRHVLGDAPPMSSLPLSLFIGKALVADVRNRNEIGPGDLKDLPLSGVRRLLLKTDNSRLWKTRRFCPQHVSLTEAGAVHLLETDIELVGIDYLSIEGHGGSGIIHRMLLEKGIVILEGLDLSRVDAGRYELICLPLKTAAEDGAPARAILRELDGNGRMAGSYPLFTDQVANR